MKRQFETNEYRHAFVQMSNKDGLVFHATQHKTIEKNTIIGLKGSSLLLGKHVDEVRRAVTPDHNKYEALQDHNLSLEMHNT